MSCEIISKTTGDRVNVAAGVMAVVGSLAILGFFCGPCMPGIW